MVSFEATFAFGFGLTTKGNLVTRGEGLSLAKLSLLILEINTKLLVFRLSFKEFFLQARNLLLLLVEFGAS
jgi:hypothetical protein